jgi:hypothetical protein
MTLWDNGGGDVPHDQHLYVSPAGNSTSALLLVDGVITLPWDPIRRAVINLEYNEKDNTTKMFMTDRSDPRGIFDVVYGCNPDTDALQTELHIKSRGDVEQGGEMGVKPIGTNHDFRWRAPGTTSKSASSYEKLQSKVLVLIVVQFLILIIYGKRSQWSLFMQRRAVSWDSIYDRAKVVGTSSGVFRCNIIRTLRVPCLHFIAC